MEERIVIGYRGEIGSAITKIFNATKGIGVSDMYLPALVISPSGEHINEKEKADRTIMHICIPYIKDFTKTVIHYVDKYTPDIVIIHTTCAIGTTREINNLLGNSTTIVVHASVNCRHPNTEADIRKYDMFVGAMSEIAGNEACDYIERFGIVTYLCDTPESSEFNKIAGTEYCKTMVEFFGYLKKLADDDNKLNWKECIAYFENLMNKSDGWKRVYRRGNRIDTPISGKHCLNTNHKLWELYVVRKASKTIAMEK
jgi:hypothetical protein